MTNQSHHLELSEAVLTALVTSVVTEPFSMTFADDTGAIFDSFRYGKGFALSAGELQGRT